VFHQHVRRDYDEAIARGRPIQMHGGDLNAAASSDAMEDAYVAIRGFQRRDVV